MSETITAGTADKMCTDLWGSGEQNECERGVRPVIFWLSEALRSISLQPLLFSFLLIFCCVFTSSINMNDQHYRLTFTSLRRWFFAMRSKTIPSNTNWMYNRRCFGLTGMVETTIYCFPAEGEGKIMFFLLANWVNSRKCPDAFSIIQKKKINK